MGKDRLLFVDAETDGLYGSFISVAIIVTDLMCNEKERFYYGVRKDKLQISSSWVKENVFPKLGDYEPYDDEVSMLNAVWGIWERYKEQAYAVADVCFPVEARLFRRCVELDEDERMFNAPYPLLDLSSLLYAKGYDPLISREQLLRAESDELKHNALYDIEQSLKIYKKIMGV